jgi:nicotinate dehydrogenase subunit A
MSVPPATHRTLKVNGRSLSVAAGRDATLLEALRAAGLGGTRFGCGTGHCGACTVLVDGRPATSCNLRIEEVGDARITTIEGLGPAGAPGPVQAVFLDHQAAQCGYCINGMIVALTGLLAQRPRPDRAAILAWLDERHICRCGAHLRILRAVDALLEAGG